MKQTIEIPEGYELVKVSDTEYKIQKKERALPKTWEEFCELSSIKIGERFISDDSYILNIFMARRRNPVNDINVLPSEEVAEAVLALCQLIQLRDYYNDGWKPNLDNFLSEKYCIVFTDKEIKEWKTYSVRHFLVFKTPELRDEFLKNFKDLIVKLKALYP